MQININQKCSQQDGGCDYNNNTLFESPVKWKMKSLCRCGNVFLLFKLVLKYLVSEKYLSATTIKIVIIWKKSLNNTRPDSPDLQHMFPDEPNVPVL